MFVVIIGFKTALLSLLSNTAILSIIGFDHIPSTAVTNAIVLGLSIIVGILVYSIATWLNSKEQLKELWELAGLKKESV